MFVAQGFRFKFLLFDALPHNLEGSGERPMGHYGPLVDEHFLVFEVKHIRSTN